jgi:hypothetical protein
MSVKFYLYRRESWSFMRSLMQKVKKFTCIDDSVNHNCTRAYPKVSGLSHNEINNNNNKHSLRSNTKGYGGKTHKIAIQLHLMAESFIICSSRSRWPVRKLVDTPSYIICTEYHCRVINTPGLDFRPKTQVIETEVSGLTPYSQADAE